MAERITPNSAARRSVRIVFLLSPRIICASSRAHKPSVDDGALGRDGGHAGTEVASRDGGRASAQRLYQWLRSNEYVVAVPNGGGVVQLIQAESGKPFDVLTPLEATSSDARTDPVLTTGGTYARPLVSPDERHIAFVQGTLTYMAPFAINRSAKQSEWRLVFKPTRRGERVCGWSPDGRLLHFLLERGGFRCLYALRIDPRGGGPVGEMFVVAHLHNGSRQWGSTGSSSAVVNGLFLFDHVGLKGNLWMLH